jgi:hypothetical protein
VHLSIFIFNNLTISLFQRLPFRKSYAINDHPHIFLEHVWPVPAASKAARSSIRVSALCLAGYRSSMSFLRAVKGEERKDVASRTRGNTFLLPSRSAFSTGRYFAEEFNEELPHNLQLRQPGFLIWPRIFLNFYHLAFFHIQKSLVLV